MWVPLNGDAAEGFDVEALLERSETVSGSEGVEVRARGWDGVVVFIIVVVVCNGTHFLFYLI